MDSSKQNSVSEPEYSQSTPDEQDKLDIPSTNEKRNAQEPNEHTPDKSAANQASNETSLDVNDSSQNQFDTTAELKHETRALWAHAGYLAKTKQDIDDLVTKVDDANLNVILLLVYRAGAAYFEPSHTRFPDSADRLSNQSKFAEAGYPDALSYLLTIRDERRLDDDPTNDFEVHAWFTVMQNGDYVRNKGWPRPDNTKPYMLHYLHPEFKIKYECYYSEDNEACMDHRYSAVHIPKFRAYMTDLIAGLAEDYDVDGVHLDYIRAIDICYNNEPLDYPGTEYDYPGCQEDYKAWTRETYGQEYTLWDDVKDRKIQDGDSGRIAAWQEQAVGKFVKGIHDEVKSVRPDVIISAAVGLTSPDPEQRKMSKQGQAAWEWVDNGWLDAAFVMSYNPDTQIVVNRTQSFMDAIQSPQRRLRIFPGLSTFTIDDKDEKWSYLIEEQISATMRGQWPEQPVEPSAKGAAFFVDRHLSQEAIEILANGSFKEPALPFWGESKTGINALQDP